MSDADTIVAISSGSLPSGVAILRVSGCKCDDIRSSFSIKPLVPRILTYTNIYSSVDGSVIDKCLVVSFLRNSSFTGEDCIEFHLHGSSAVLKRMISEILTIEGVRLAVAGEFTRRAFENGRLSFSGVEGLSDLLRADTENQRIQALARAFGGFESLINEWRKHLIRILVLVEAELDFSDESDVGSLDINSLVLTVESLQEQIQESLDNFDFGKIIKDGLRIGVGGLPNVGKSSIVNQLSRSDVSIVTSKAGTTRDIVEVSLEIDGQLVIFSDSAGIRESDDEIELAGIERARIMLERSDLVLWISAPDIDGSDIVPQLPVPVLHVSNKSDLGICAGADLNVSAKSGNVRKLADVILSKFSDNNLDRSSLVFSRESDRIALSEANLILLSVLKLLNTTQNTNDLELIAEDLRRTAFVLERLLGKVDSETVLGELFAGFCIGK